jgi:bacterioferritin-associated ferredoxin
MLKKEFKRKDVNRMRNLITGNVGDSSETQIGYNKKIKKYTEGDIWVENKKTWTIKNGIKQTISKLDKIRKETFMPLCCPKCGNVMKKRLDKPNYRIHKKCHDCVIEFEHKLKIKGLYDKYVKVLKVNNNLEYLNEIESYLLDAVNKSNNGYVSEDGVIERWVGGVDKKEMTKQIANAAKKTRNKLKKEIKNEKN